MYSIYQLTYNISGATYAREGKGKKIDNKEGKDMEWGRKWSIGFGTMGHGLYPWVTWAHWDTVARCVDSREFLPGDSPRPRPLLCGSDSRASVLGFFHVAVSLQTTTTGFLTWKFQRNQVTNSELVRDRCRFSAAEPQERVIGTRQRLRLLFPLNCMRSLLIDDRARSRNSLQLKNHRQ